MADVRNLLFIPGDQLDPDAPAFENADPVCDVVVMAETEAEVRRYPNHRQRMALFYAAMRHFRDRLRERGYTVVYQQLDDEQAADSLSVFLRDQVQALHPETIVMTEPGQYELEQLCRTVAQTYGVGIQILPDTHFFCSREDFKTWAGSRKTLVMEHFYRSMRKRYGYLMQGNAPVGGAWNFDKENRTAFKREGPLVRSAPLSFTPDGVTQEVLGLVEARLSGLQGSVQAFDWPVTPEDAHRAVDDFVANRLPFFGTYQDAMWTNEPYLYHARLSTALNLKLVNPRSVVEKVVEAYEAGHAPLNSVEGFVRQVLGWREFIRGVYWLSMPGYEALNALQAERNLPAFYWSGDTHMQCMREVVEQLLRYGYAHHIQRLMVTGLFALLYGVKPTQVHEWYMAMFVDSVDWVTLPNTIGMSQYADGGIVGTKPYIATGKYIKRMSNYCLNCRYNPDKVVGEEACPFTTLYWKFLMTHGEHLAGNRRMGLQLRNLTRKTPDERIAISEQAERIHLGIQRGGV